MNIDFNSVSRMFLQVLRNLDITALQGDISEYSMEYLKRHRANAEFRAYLYSQICAAAAKQSGIQSREQLSAAVFCDYGAGTGLLGVYARMAGFGTVICSDIYELAMQDAEKIGRALGFPAHQYLTGELEVLRDKNITVIAGMDVIEHIYQLDRHFENLGRMDSLKAVVHLTGANIMNPLMRNRLNKVQRTCEFSGWPERTGAKPRDEKRPYLQVRREMIAAAFPELGEDQLNLAAQNTRGLAGVDISLAVKAFLNSGKWPALPSGANTCDPRNGNWAEHLLSIQEYRNFAAGFSLQVNALGYDQWNGNIVSRNIKAAVNGLGRLMPQKLSLRILPLLLLQFKK